MVADPLTVKVMHARGRSQLPIRAYPTDAGLDLFVCESVMLVPGEWKDIHTGIIVETPPGWWGMIVGRSSTLRRRGIRVETGIIDEGFRGELFVLAHNMNQPRFNIPDTGTDDTGVRMVEEGERLAQLLLFQTPPPLSIEWTDNLSDSERGTSGFGSSGS